MYKSHLEISHEFISPEVAVHTFEWIGAFKNFAKFAAKHLWWSLFLIQLKASACNFVQKKLQHRCFLVNFAKSFSAPFLQNTPGNCLSTEEFSLRTNYYSSKRILLKQQLVTAAMVNFLFYLSVCFNIQNLNSCPAVVLASTNLFTMKIKDWRSVISARSRALNI